MKIKAIVSPAPEKPFEIQEVELEDPRSNEVLVRITGTGLCHTDLGAKSIMPIPAVLGHEGSGIVEKVGEHVTTVKPGDRVVISFSTCGTCDNCLAGKPFGCINGRELNFSGARADGSMPITKDGAPLFGCWFGQSSFAEYSLTTERNLVKVPEDVPLEILGPLGCGVMTGAGTVMNAINPPAGSSIAVFGTGAVGLSAVMAAKVVGCSCIIGVDIKPERLKSAEEFGATHVINAADKNPVDEIMSITGTGVNYSIETAGVPAVYRQAFDSLDMTGECILLGAAPIGSEVTFDMSSMLSGKKTRGVYEGESVPQQFIPKMIEMYQQGKLPFDKMITFYDPEDINQAVEDSEKGLTIKAVLRFNT